MKQRHTRLIAFFALLAVLGVAVGFAVLGADGVSIERARWAVVAAAGFAAFVGLLGVFVHRKSVLVAKQVEVERYLARIEHEAAKSLALLEGAVDMLLELDPETGVVLEANALARGRLGLDAAHEGSGGQALEALFPPADRTRFAEALERAVTNPGLVVDLQDVRVVDGDGRAFPAAARIVVVRVQEQRIVELLLRDLREQKDLERRLRLHEQLGALGLLTASVAHEINNPLEGMANYVHLLQREDLAPEDRARYVERIGHGIERIGDLARDLLRFSRPVTSSGVADLARVVEHAVELARYSKHCRAIEFKRVNVDEPAWVHGNERPLEQVVVNLLMNAGKAMEGRGAVSLEIQRGVGPEPDCELVISDGGPGIGRDDPERIFEPLFTTGDGHGLGLSIAQEIVRAHGGTLTVRDRDEGGAEFRITLPGAARPASEPVEHGGRAER